VSGLSGPIKWNAESLRDNEAMHALQLAQEKKFIEGLHWFTQVMAYRQGGYK